VHSKNAHLEWWKQDFLQQAIDASESPPPRSRGLLETFGFAND
jgi:hypothetical protein